MSVELITAIIAAVVAVVGAIISIYGQARTTRLEHQLAQQREKESREATVAAIMAKYRDPLLRAAFDLQSRLFSTVQLGFLQIYYRRSPADREYAVQNTLYVIAEYLGWVEILRREVQFLDLGDVEMNRRLVRLLDNITQAFLTDGVDLTLRLFRGEQRAIGEIMLATRSATGTDGTNHECIGFAAFTQRLNEPDFARWFAKLQDGIEKLATEPHAHEERLIVLQHALIDLIDFLDSDCIRIPKENRQRIEFVR
jgi:hypothetical protein